jgi:universal stress protein A
VTTQHILVPVDFSEHSEQALEYAMSLAPSLRARLTLLHVIQVPILAAGPHMGAGMALASYLEQIESDMSHTLEACAKRVRAAGLTCETVIVHGVPFQQIIDLAADRDVDLIVMSTYGRTGLPHMLLGSVAEKVVRLAPCPVLVTRVSDATATP